MPNTKMTREKFKQHVYYQKYIYLVVMIAAVMVGSLIYTTTSYRAPNERRIDIELIGDYADTGTQTAYDALDYLLAFGQAWETAQDAEAGIDTTADDYEPALQEVAATGLIYTDSGTSDNDYYAAQKYMVLLAAQEGDIYFVSRDKLVDLIDNNIAVSLDDYIAEGIIDPGERNLSAVTFDGYDDDGNATGESHVYALQAAYMTGLYDTFQYVPDTKYAVIVAFSQNQDTAAAILGEMVRLYDTDITAEAAPIADDGAFAQPDDDIAAPTEGASQDTVEDTAP